MINIMYIINESQFGGAAISLFDALEVRKDSINPIVIIPSTGEIQEYLEWLPIKYYIVPFELNYAKIGFYTSMEADRVFADNYCAALRLQDIIREEKIQLIHINSSVSNVGAMAAIIADIPYVWHVRELLEEHFGIEFLDRKLQLELFKYADKIVAISECVKNAFWRKYGIETICIYNGISARRFLDANFSVKRKNYFMIAGTIAPAKGQLDVVRAVNELVEKKMDIQLYIVGAAVGYQYTWLLHKYIKKKGLEHNIHVFPFRNDLSELRRQCQYSITASRMEALGRVTIEAMLAGCVAIGADTGGTAEIIGRDRSRGYLFEQGNYKDLARVMREALAHSANNASLQKRAQSYALEQFDTAKYVEKIVKIYKDAVYNRKNEDTCEKAALRRKLEDRYREAINLTKTVSYVDTVSNEKEQKLREIKEIWLNEESGRLPIAETLKKRGIYSIAVYGMGYLGCHFYDALEDSGVAIRYVMDRELENIDGVLRVIKPGEELPEVDAVIVTVLGDMDKICSLIKSKCNYKILTLTKILRWSREERGST